MVDLRVEPGGENEATRCECCGRVSRTVWGYVYEESGPIAAYFVQWTRHAAEHLPNLDFLVGTWGDDSVHDKRLVSWVFDPKQGSGGSFMVVDGTARPAAGSNLCSQALTREQVVGDSHLLELAKSMIDAVWLGDPRIEEVRLLVSGRGDR